MAYPTLSQDPEKQEHQAHVLRNSPSADDRSRNNKGEFEEAMERRRASQDSDPLSELGDALAPENIAEPELQQARSNISNSNGVSRLRTGTSIGSTASRPPDYEVVFEVDDPENPKTWALWYRMWVVFVVSWACFSVVIFSSNYASSIPGMMADFNEPNETIVTLGITTYLVGLAVGSLVVAPMSELFGRKVVYIVCQIIATILIIPTGLATSLKEILVVRFFV
jgi:hypothetical protein